MEGFAAEIWFTTAEVFAQCPACGCSILLWADAAAAFQRRELRCDGCGFACLEGELDLLVDAICQQNPTDPTTFARTWLHLHRSAEGEL